MRQLMPPCILLSLSLAVTSLAQPAADAPQPALPSKLQYVSPLQTYMAYADQPVGSWREANDLVGRIGGWRAYAREVQGGVPANQAPQSPAKEPSGSVDPHASHHGVVTR